MSRFLPRLSTLVAVAAIAVAPSTAMANPDVDACAVENGSCTIGDASRVFYGANNAFVQRNAQGSIACDNATFGDPIHGVVKACYATRRCAGENGRCNFAGPHTVFYGARGTWTSRVFTDGIDCNNATFGDPLPGVVKECYVVTGGDTLCRENNTCNFRGSRTVFYGDGGSWVNQNHRFSVDCNNGIFGDPIHGVVKSCIPTTRCASENGRCMFSGPRLVFYGDGNSWSAQEHVGGVDCNNGIFGDPIHGVVKSCFVSEP